MRASRWLVAVATVPHGRNTCASPGVLAFVNYAPGTRRTLLSSAAHSTTTISVSSLRSGSSNSALLNRPSLSPCRLMMISTSGGGGGESWCGHELLNTVTTDWVKDHLHDPEVALVDIRGRVNKRREGGSDYFGTDYEGLKEDYLDAHIPGAVFVDWTKRVARTASVVKVRVFDDVHRSENDMSYQDIAEVDENGVPAQLSDRDSFVEAMQERGIAGDRRVVVYDNGDMLFATRFWWAMRRFGHDRVSVMDGGWAKWQAENKDITPDCPCPLKVYAEWDIPPERERPELVASAGDVRAALEKGDCIQLLDARAATQFTGEVRRARRGGHIPGAVNTPYRGFLAEGSGPDGDYRVFKGLDDIKKVFESAAVDVSPSAPPAIAYCNGGVASTVALFLLCQLRWQGQGGGTGTDGSTDGGSWANYDGSWNEWGNDEAAPVEQ